MINRLKPKPTKAWEHFYIVTSPGGRGGRLLSAPGQPGLGAGMLPAQARGNKAPGVMQQNRLELCVEINHPWRQGREEEDFCSRASPHLTKPQNAQAGSESWGRIQPAVTPAALEQSWSWPGTAVLRLSQELVFHPFAAPLASPCGRQC